MKLKFLVIWVLSLSFFCCSGQTNYLNGRWIVTKCLSAYINNPKIGLDEIKRNLGGEILINVQNKSIVTHLGGFVDTTNNISFSITKKPFKSYFDQASKFYEYIGYKSDSLQVVQTTEQTFYSEFLLIDPETIVITVDGFLLFLNKLNDNKKVKEEVIKEKTHFYTSDNFAREFNYYVIEGDRIQVLFKRGNGYFVKYHKPNGNNYYGWVHLNTL